MKRFLRRMFYGLIAFAVVSAIILLFVYIMDNFKALVSAVLIMVLVFLLGTLIDQYLN